MLHRTPMYNAKRVYQIRLRKIPMKKERGYLSQSWFKSPLTEVVQKTNLGVA